MLVIAGVVRIDPAHRDEVIGAAIEVMQKVRNQTGCISYVVATDLEDSTVLHLFQEWQSEEAHRAHLADPRVESVLLRVGSLGVREVAVQQYEIASISPLV